MRHTILAVIAGVITCAAAQAGDVYKYTDSAGKTMYTDKPIPGAILVSSTQRPVDAQQRSYATQQANQNAALNASNQRIAEGQDNERVAAAVSQDLAASRAERCKKARDDYNQSIQSLRMYREVNGKREYLSDAELTQARVDAKRAVDTVCGPQG